MLAASTVLWRLVGLAILAVQVYALVDAAVRPAAAYEAASRWTKTGWVTVLAISLVIGQALSLFSFIGLAALVATIVYFVDVRPALQRLG
ncbi:MAG TPA: DUF2516 family protein [Acidothermaceae bacterium]|jgi:hypothetical protein